MATSAAYASGVWRTMMRCLAGLLPVLYLLHITADNIGGIFGVMWPDEGTYLLSAKNQVLFGQMHFFPGDAWRPELIAPLLHHYALATITPEHPLLWVRLGMAIIILTGAFIIACIAGRHYRSRDAAIACFICVLLSPVLFFYSHAGLSEGLQFFLLALALAVLYRLHASAHAGEAILLAVLAGALTAGLFISKINTAAICVAISTGAAAAIAGNPQLSRKVPPLAAYVLAAAAMLAWYFLGVIGPHFSDWWQSNITMQMARRVSFNPLTALEVFLVKMPDIAFFLCLMPVFALYFLSLLIGADGRRGYVFVLVVITLTVITLESFLGGDLRRNFFSLAMLSILSGFVVTDYAASGITLRLRPLTPEKAAAVFLLLAQALGMGFLLVEAARQDGWRNALFCALFLGLMLLALLARGEAYAGLRRLLMTVVTVCSLMPMLFQAFLAPYTRAEVTAALESATPPDAVIVGHSAPWMFTGLRRRLIFTNCTLSTTQTLYANDIDRLPLRADYYLSDVLLVKDRCIPENFAQYQNVGMYFIFFPINSGGWGGAAGNWGYRLPILLYKNGHAH